VILTGGASKAGKGNKKANEAAKAVLKGVRSHIHHPTTTRSLLLTIA
jgi:hypothetical protein